MSSELKKKTVSAVIFNFVEKFGQQILYLLTGVIVARLVSPEQYGLVGLLGLFVAIPTMLAESGFATALIREKEIGDDDYSSVFMYNLLMSLGLYVLMFLCAPLLSSFYNEPSLTLIARVQFLSIIFYSLGLVQYIELTRNMAFKSLTKLNISALAISSLTSVVMAFNGMNVWALVCQQVLFAFCRMVGLWIVGKRKVGFNIKIKVLKKYWSFSNKLILVSMLNAFANNIYALIIGKVYNKADVGYYTQANKYQEIPSSIVTNSFRSVVLSVLSKVQDEEQRALEVTRRIIGLISFIIFPSMFILATIARPFLVLLLSDIWLPSVPIFRVLCFAGSFIPFTIILGDSLSTMGRSELTLRYELIRKSFLLIGIAFLFGQGIMSLAYWWIAYMLFSLLVALKIIKRIFPYGIRLFTKDVGLHIIVSALWATVASQTESFYANDILQIISQSLIIAIGYLTSLYALKDKTLKEVLIQVKSIIQKKWPKID